MVSGVCEELLDLTFESILPMYSPEILNLIGFDGLDFSSVNSICSAFVVFLPILKYLDGCTEIVFLSLS